jgi:RNA polymerase sigma factor (sigma-70 family)
VAAVTTGLLARVIIDEVPGTSSSTTAAAVRQALAQLSAEHRAVIWRSYYRGWTLARIAEDLQIAEGTVKWRLHDGLRALHRTLRETGLA